jgi:hypothetical protein
LEAIRCTCIIFKKVAWGSKQCQLDVEKPDDHTSLSDNMYVLTLLAFYFHQIFELTDKQFQDCRVAYGSKQQLWGILRVKVRFLLFDSWEDLLDNLLSNPEPSEGYRYKP